MSTIHRQTAVADVAVRRFGRFSLFAAVYTYLLVLFGGLVRITGSGLGCGDDWPKCHGVWIPEFTVETLIEYMHRLLGVTIGLVLIGLALYAYRHRKHPRFRGPGGLAAPAYGVVFLVLVQGLLGAVTVWLELPTAVVVVHFMTALIILGMLLVGAVRAGALGTVGAPEEPAAARRHARAATAAAILAFSAITLGALTANTTSAPQACQGFPLCNGTLLPASVPQVHVHWGHRLLAFALLLHVLVVALRAQRIPSLIRRAAVYALLLVAGQIVVAAALVLLHLPSHLQVLHLGVGAATWAAIVAWTTLARAAAAHTTAQTHERPIAAPLA
ncbi:MAG: COX15/CtaA family protein [Longimicrobiales bacterium]